MTILFGLDFESSGLVLTEDRPVQVGLVFRDQADGYATDYPLVDMLCHPGKLIDPGAAAVHGITDAMVATAPTAREVVDYATQLVAYYSQGREAYLVGFNSNNFDLPMANNTLQRRAFTLPHIDALRLARHHFADVKGHLGGKTLGELHQVFLGRPLEKAHSAVADIVGTLDLLEALRIRAGVTLAQLAEEQAIARPYRFMPIGKYMGLPIEEVPRSWATFMATKGDLDPDLRATVNAVLSR